MFSYSAVENRTLQLELNRKLNAIKMQTLQSEFTFEQPEMIYDKKTGDVIIIDKSAEKKQKIIRNLDDLNKERAKIHNELDGISDIDEKAKRSAELYTKFMKTYEMDPTVLHVFSRDMFRCDVGLIIHRPPIFLKMSPRDVEHLKMRSQVMNEYHIDQKKYTEEFKELSKLNSDILENNPYCSTQNLDNYPSHQLGDDTYSAASKHWVNVDPAMQDTRSIHYAAEDRTYLIFKNRHTGEWQFPAAPMRFGQTFTRGKQDLFTSLSADKWRIKFNGLMPQQHTMRHFSEAEKEE